MEVEKETDEEIVEETSSKKLKIDPSPQYVYVYCDNEDCGKCRKITQELYLSLKIEEMDKWYCFNNPNEEFNTCTAPLEEGCDVMLFS